MQNDPRYTQARQLQQSMVARHGQGGPMPPGAGPPPAGYPGGPPGVGGPPIGSLAHTQMLQLRAQIMAYRILARNQPLPPQIAMAVQVRMSNIKLRTVNSELRVLKESLSVWNMLDIYSKDISIF